MSLLEAIPDVGLLDFFVEWDGMPVCFSNILVSNGVLKSLIVTGFGTPNFGILKDIVLKGN